jgi:hypothetical protein
MGVQKENGLALQVQRLAERLEALTETLGGLERENAELRSKVAALEGSGTRREEVVALGGQHARQDAQTASESSEPEEEGRVSRKWLLSKAGAAAVAAVAAGTLLNPRQAKADHSSDTIMADHVVAHRVFGDLSNNFHSAVWGHNRSSGLGVLGTSNGTAVLGESISGTGVEGVSDSFSGVGVEGIARGSNGKGVQGTGRYGVWGESNQAGFYGVTGRNTNTDGTGVRGVTSNNGRAGVRGEGAIGVWGNSSKTGHGAVYGQHTGSMGYGVVGDGKGNGAGVLGRNNSGVGYEAFGVKGETADAIGVKGIGRNGVIGESSAGGHGAVYGRHTGSSGYGVVGDGRGPGAGVLGRNSGGYGGEFEGGKAQLKLKPAASAGKPTTGTHTKGEVYMDSAGALFVCTAGDGTSVGTWKKVNMNLV